MNYRIFGTGHPIVTIHPFAGRARRIAALTRRHRQIAIELDPPGRRSDGPAPARFERQAERVVALLRTLQVERAGFFGESLGGIVAIRIALAYPALVDRVAIYGTALSGFDDVAHSASLGQLMTLAAGTTWTGFTPEALRSIDAPVLVAAGDRDLLGPRLEHHLDVYRVLPNAKLAIIPDAGHFATAGDVALWSTVGAFLGAVAGAASGTPAAAGAVSLAIEAGHPG